MNNNEHNYKPGPITYMTGVNHAVLKPELPV